MSQATSRYSDNLIQIATIPEKYLPGATICFLPGQNNLDRESMNNALQNGGIAFRAHLPPTEEVLLQHIKNIVENGRENTLERVIILNDDAGKCIGQTAYQLIDGDIPKMVTP